MLNARHPQSSKTWQINNLAKVILNAVNSRSPELMNIYYRAYQTTYQSFHAEGQPYIEVYSIMADVFLQDLRTQGRLSESEASLKRHLRRHFQSTGIRSTPPITDSSSDEESPERSRNWHR